MQKLKSSFACFHCSKKSKNPNLKNLKEKDQAAHSDVKDNKSKSNNSIQKQKDNKRFLNEEKNVLKQNIEESIKVIHQMHEELTSSKTKLDSDFQEHFQEIRSQLDQHREQLKDKFDVTYMEMIDKTKEYEASHLKNFNDKLSVKTFEIKSIDSELKQLEEKFREPNLLIEPIKQLQIIQEEDIQTIQSKLVEIIKVKDDLKASNEFTPNLSFNESLFGHLYLNNPFKSQILEGQQPSELIKLCGFNKADGFKLLYRASEHGFGAYYFHLKCDGHANTLTIFKANESSFVFGGFTTATWNSSSQWKSDANAFLFSLTNKDNQPCKMNIDPNQHHKAIYCYYECGPTFGYKDIEMNSDSRSKNFVHTNLGNTYKHHRYAFGTNEAQSFLAGSYNFF